MNNTKISDKTEFEARQGCFDFGEACRFVNDLIADVKKSLAQWAKGFIRKIAMARQAVMFAEQLALNLTT